MDQVVVILLPCLTSWVILELNLLNEETSYEHTDMHKMIQLDRLLS